MFLAELFHVDHFPRNKYLKAVLLTAAEPSDDLKALVESARYQSRTVTPRAHVPSMRPSQARLTRSAPTDEHVEQESIGGLCQPKSHSKCTMS